MAPTYETTPTGLSLKWGLSLQPRLSSNSCWPSCSSLSSSYSSSKGKDINYDTATVFVASVLTMESEASFAMKANTRPSACQMLDNNYSQTEEIKVNIDKLSAGLQHERLTFLTSLQANKTSQYSLLLESLVILEDTFSDSDVVMLERDILVQLERLGALKLFHTSLSKTLESPSSSEPINNDVDKSVVLSTKKEERKLRRERASRRANNICNVELPSKARCRKKSRRVNFSARRSTNIRGRRFKISRNEAELARGVKLVASLERLRMELEGETGTVASYSRWAAAAGIEKSVLLENLQFGWRCRDELLRSTRSLVVYLARNYRGQGMAFEDLIQAGKLGVLEGAERFDQSRGNKFSTYVQYWIRRSMSTLISQHSRAIRIPFKLSKAINEIQKASRVLHNRGVKYRDDVEIAKLTGLSLAKIESASKCLKVVGSIDQEIGYSKRTKFMEVTPDTRINTPEEAFGKQLMIKELNDLLNGLEARERKVIFLRLGFEGYQPKSLEEIGRIFGVSKEWIRRLEKRALTKLKGGDIEALESLRHYLYV